LTNTLQKKLNKVRKEKAALEKLIEKEKVEHEELERKVAQLQGTGSIEKQLQAENSISGATAALKDEPLSGLGARTAIPGEEGEEEDAPIPR
jgi:predicted  nucleic acid-binding Zn-ribbon protein